MILSISIVFALLVTIGLPVLAGVWINKHLKVTWQVITLGALGYFIVQALFTLLYSGFAFLIKIETSQPLVDIDNLFHLVISIFITALLGVTLRWTGMKYLKMPLINLEAAYGIGLGFSGIESITRVGLPLLMTFFTMVRGINSQTSHLEPEIMAQLNELWKVSPWVPLAGSFERIAALVMHITITILVLEYFISNNKLWLGAAVGLEVVINALILGLVYLGLPSVWLIPIAMLVTYGNLVLLHRLNAFRFSKPTPQSDTSA